MSRRVLNEEKELLQLISDVRAPAEDVLWAVDVNRGGATLQTSCCGQPSSSWSICPARLCSVLRWSGG